MTISEHNFKLVIEYDGGAYHGWQRQKGDRTIQEEIEKALKTMTREKVTLIGSGRTDAGVHALGQTAGFRCRTRLDADVFQKGLNSLLDDDIVIRECREMNPDFHARFDVKSKRYRYRILNRFLPSAIERRYLWHIRGGLNLKRMRDAAEFILGEHDFKAFEGTGSPRASTLRTIYDARWREMPGGVLEFEISGNGFLRYMVRNIVGTLADVGRERMTPSGFRAVLQSGQRCRAGATAPAHGLFLVQVLYE